MKKLLGILVLSLLWCNISFANASWRIESFTQWLYDNGHHQYLNLNPDAASYRATAKNKKDTLVNLHMTHVSKSTAEANAMAACERAFKTQGKEMQKACYIDSVVEVNPCKTEPKYSQAWYYNKCHKFRGTTNLKIKLNKKKRNIAYHSNPNRDTLLYYLWDYAYRARDWYEVKPSKKPYEFKFNLIEDKFVKKQMKTKGIMSYLYFQDGHILIDEISPKERLGEFINNETKFYSMSMSKSVVSYILGHAICGGYIDGVDARINDWPLIENTLYHNQKLIDFLNMSAGDQKYINEFKYDGAATGKLLAHLNYSFEDATISMTAALLKDSVKSKSIYNYNGFVTQLIINYIKYKTGDDYKKLLNKVFADKVKIKYSIYPTFSRREADNQGNLHPNLNISRYDWLRIAKAVMDDYQNDTCVGKYLKEIYDRRIPKNYNKEKNEPHFNRTKSYGGQFHMDYPGLKDRVVFGFGGYGGNAILIDVENSRIVVLNSLHYNNKRFKYSHTKLLIDPIKNGK